MSLAATTRYTGITDLRAFLEGRWNLEREIDDKRLGQHGTLKGEAAFTPEGEGLLYRERGLLSLDGHEGEAYQIYRYDFPTPRHAVVCFQDGRLFHDLDLSGGRCTAEHRCGDDLYQGRFLVAEASTGPSIWESAWRVTGPRKNLLLTSRYRRDG